MVPDHQHLLMEEPRLHTTNSVVRPPGYDDARRACLVFSSELQGSKRDAELVGRLLGREIVGQEAIDFARESGVLAAAPLLFFGFLGEEEA
jgi:hypothetical protein